MKRVYIYIITIFSVTIISCAKTNEKQANKAYEDCINTEVNATLYGDELEDYCSCIKNEILTSTKESISEDDIKEITQHCANKHTSLETNF